MMNIELCSTLNCTQCGSCVEACSRHAVSFSAHDKYGDKCPIIDKSLCVNCGSCIKACPQLFSIASEVAFKQSYYAGWSRKYRKNGSSGGVFSELAEYIYVNKGFVCGAAFDEYGRLSHLLTDNFSDLKRLVGSKYLTSEVHKCFPQIKNKLRGGKLVLFVGTPCQVAGLKKYLKRDYDNLLLVDLVCFGCPSQEVYKAYINKIPTTNPIVEYKFRYLKSNRPDCRVVLSDGTTVRLPNKYYTYVDGFVHGYCMKKSCYSCQYKNMNRVGDITLGDYHSISKEKPLLRRKISKGVSLIGVNTIKGEMLLGKISKKLELFPKNRKQAEMTNLSLREQLSLTAKRDEYCSAMMNEKKSLEQINEMFGLYGLKYSCIRFNPFFIRLLDLKKDICQIINSFL